jgi:hypothetical protein
MTWTQQELRKVRRRRERAKRQKCPEEQRKG